MEDKPRAISELLLERMVLGGATKICFVIAPSKTDLLAYFGSGRMEEVSVSFVTQPQPTGLCDAIFQAMPLIPVDEFVLLGFPDAVWLPRDAMARLGEEDLSFLLFPVEQPQHFDAVVTSETGRVLEIQVQQINPTTRWIWGAIKVRGSILRKLHLLWLERDRKDEFLGSLVNAWILQGGEARGVRAGEFYVEIGTFQSYRRAMSLLSRGKRDRRSRMTIMSAAAADLSSRIQELGDWFHNLDLEGVATAPNHFLGDYPRVKWHRFEKVIPKDLSGRTVLDIGCNAGFYSLEMKRRGAERVVGIDSDPRYLAQARLASEVCGLKIELRELSVYDVGRLHERFDLVIFMGVLYHLRHPLLALDLIHEHVTRDLLLFQSMQRGDAELTNVDPDYPFEETGIFEHSAFPHMSFIEHRYAGDPTNWWVPNRACCEAMLRSAGYQVIEHPEEEVYLCHHQSPGAAMIEAVMFWNEPNNKSHWNPELDPEWDAFATMVNLAGKTVARISPSMTRVLGGISPIDPHFIHRMKSRGVMDSVDVAAVHGFPLDWNLWPLNSWPEKLKEIQAVTNLPVWVTEVGVSSFGAEEVQEFGLLRTASLLKGLAPRIHWYSLYDLPQAWPATTRHREAEGSSYYRHFHMGLLREDGTPKLAALHFASLTPDMGICQWFHFEDPRLDDAVAWLRRLGVRHLRTGLSWADSFRPGWENWFDRQMSALQEFEVTVTFCFTPEHRGMAPHHTSPPLDPAEYADFCARMIERYVPSPTVSVPALANDVTVLA